MDMMGVGNPKPTMLQKRLRTIIMGKHVQRRFRFEQHRKQQRDFRDLRVRFINASDPATVEKLGKALTAIDYHLSQAQDTKYIDRLQPWVSVGDVAEGLHRKWVADKYEYPKRWKGIDRCEVCGGRFGVTTGNIGDKLACSLCVEKANECTTAVAP